MTPEMEAQIYQTIHIVNLANLLRQIKEADTNYEIRNPLVYNALAVAQHLRYPSGIKIDSNEPEWPVVYIELPTGQVSWHLPQFEGEWDKHTTLEKFNRIDAYFTMVSQELSGALPNALMESTEDDL